MTPPRKRQVRLVVSLTLAVLLASGLIYTSFSAANPALTPTQLLRDAHPNTEYQLSGTVVSGSIRWLAHGVVDFSLADRAGGGRSVGISYSGSVPPAFRVGRELIVTVSKTGSGFVARPSSMITRCPSKYSAAPGGSSA
jgi:cytochrome c-type biogenesis protein CcmE